MLPAGRKALPSRARLEAESPIARRAVGIVAADLLRERLQADENSVIGVGWGRTIAEVPNHLVGVTKPRAKFVSAMGSLTRTSAANLFEVVYQFAERTGGEGHFLPVPFIANTIADRQIFMSQRIFKETLALAEQASFLSQPLDRATNTASCLSIAICQELNCKISSAPGLSATAWANFSMPRDRSCRAM